MLLKNMTVRSIAILSTLILSLPICAYAESKQDQAREWYEEGLVLYEKGEYMKALSNFGKAYTNDPSNIDYKKYKGKALVRLGSYPAAIKVLESVMEDDPIDYEIGYDIAWSYVETGDLEQAEKYLLQVIDKDLPDDLGKKCKTLLSEIQRNEFHEYNRILKLARNYDREKKYDLAEKEYIKAISLAQQSGDKKIIPDLQWKILIAMGMENYHNFHANQK